MQAGYYCIHPDLHADCADYINLLVTLAPEYDL